VAGKLGKNGEQKTQVFCHFLPLGDCTGMWGKEQTPIWHAGGQRFDPAWLHQFSPGEGGDIPEKLVMAKIGGAKRPQRRQAATSGSVVWPPPGRREGAQAA
jgi:hypothetical protein